MKVIVALAVFALSIGFAGGAQAQPAHTITWRAVNAAPGTQVSISGQQFILVRTPVRDLGGNRRFAVSFLAPRTGPALFAILTTLHSRDPLTNPIDLDGFDANVSVSDGRNYSIITNFASPGDYTFNVTAQATCTVSIKAGQTLILLTASLSTVQQPDTDIGSTPNAVPDAEWADYVHPTNQVNGCNRWVDYVRIQEIPIP
jgi:hypothetical protein